jgi:hypothetical protein
VKEREDLLEPEAVRAVELFMRSATIPLLYDHTTTHSIAGGTLFQISGRHFIVTVRHLFDGLDPERLAYPAHFMKGDLHTLGHCQISKPASDKIDVAVIELLEGATISRLAYGWRFLTLDNMASPSPDGLFVLVGYPSSLSKQVGGWVGAHGLALYSTRLANVPPQARDLVPEFDLFFDHKTTSYGREGQETETPKLLGTSGSSIWECVDSTRVVWTPEQCAKVVGVQSGYLPARYFRAAAWAAVALVLRQIDEQLGNAVDAKLSARPT